jgi:hypothetical protein
MPLASTDVPEMASAGGPAGAVCAHPARAPAPAKNARDPKATPTTAFPECIDTPRCTRYSPSQRVADSAPTNTPLQYLGVCARPLRDRGAPSVTRRTIRPVAPRPLPKLPCHETQPSGNLDSRWFSRPSNPRRGPHPAPRHPPVLAPKLVGPLPSPPTRTGGRPLPKALPTLPTWATRSHACGRRWRRSPRGGASRPGTPRTSSSRRSRLPRGGARRSPTWRAGCAARCAGGASSTGASGAAAGWSSPALPVSTCGLAAQGRRSAVTCESISAASAAGSIAGSGSCWRCGSAAACAWPRWRALSASLSAPSCGRSAERCDNSACLPTSAAAHQHPAGADASSAAPTICSRASAIVPNRAATAAPPAPPPGPPRRSAPAPRRPVQPSATGPPCR